MNVSSGGLGESGSSGKFGGSKCGMIAVGVKRAAQYGDQRVAYVLNFAKFVTINPISFFAKRASQCAN